MLRAHSHTHEPGWNASQEAKPSQQTKWQCELLNRSSEIQRRTQKPSMREHLKCLYDAHWKFAATLHGTQIARTKGPAR